MRRAEQPEYFMTRVLMSHEKFYFARLFNILACSRVVFFPSLVALSLSTRSCQKAGFSLSLHARNGSFIAGFKIKRYFVIMIKLITRSRLHRIACLCAAEGIFQAVRFCLCPG
jgi:hypothetical protein